MKTTIEEIKNVLHMMSKGYHVPQVIYDVVYETAVRELEAKKQVVIYKRDPDVNSGRMQGAFIKITKDQNTIGIHPAATSGFGADHDGDMMELYAPLSNEVQEEIRSKLMRVTDMGGKNKGMFKLQKEIFTGIFTLTFDEPKKDNIKKITSIDEAVKLKINKTVSMRYKGFNLTTTAGRLVFNNALPEWYPFVDGEVNNKTLEGILSEIIEKNQKDFVDTINNLTKIGFYYSTIYSKTISLDQFDLPPILLELKDKLSKEEDLAKQIEIQDLMEKELLNHLKKERSDIYFMIKSGGSKGMNQIRQLMVSKGLLEDPDGNILPVISKSIGDGLSTEEYFDASAAARQGTISRSLNTAHGGYTYRKFVYALGDVEINFDNKNCDTEKTLDIKLTPELYKRMGGRYVVDNEKDKIVRIDESMIGKIINLRSPIFCKTRKLCRVCYGDLADQNESRAVGMSAAQQVTSLSEKIMKCSVGQILKDNKFYSMEDFWDD